MATKEQKKHYREVKKLYCLTYLLGHPCIDCGEVDIRVLDFDHTGEHIKKANVSTLTSSGTYGLKTVIDEINKCVVRCSNCHRKKTVGTPEWFSSFDSYKGRIGLAESERFAKKPVHGTRSMYINRACRCEKCRQAQTEYMRLYKTITTGV